MIRNSSSLKNLIIIIIIIVFTLIMCFFQANYQQDKNYSTFPKINSTDKILIFSPHPDDESLGTGGVIKDAVANNASVLVVEMTNGDSISPKNFQNYLKATKNTNYNGNIGNMRETEAREAINKLGLQQKDIIFLGYPDCGLKSLFEDHWDYNDLLSLHGTSNTFNHSPYISSYQKDAPYCGANVEMNVEEIMRNYQPTIIFYPDEQDMHPDHFGTSAFVQYAEIETNYTGQSYTYLIHTSNSKHWPNPQKYFPKLHLFYPNQFSYSDGHFYLKNLTEDQENTKENAIKAHTSQIYSDQNFMLSFVRSDEIFATYLPIKIEKVPGVIDLDSLPNSYYTEVVPNPNNGFLEASYVTKSCGVAYEDGNVYLMLNDPTLQKKLNYTYHLRTFKGKNVTQLEINEGNGKATLKTKSQDKVISEQEVPVNIENNLMVISLPSNLFYGVNYMMMSVSINYLKKKEISSMAWRVFQFPENNSENTEER